MAVQELALPLVFSSDSNGLTTLESLPADVLLHICMLLTATAVDLPTQRS